MNNFPFFSVIIPVYNRETTIARAINSVLNQTYSNFEIIVINDGSTDKTMDVLNNFENIKILNTKNNGVSKARNLGVKSCSGKWLAFLDSDDEWIESKLEIQFEYIKNNPEIKIVHGEEVWVRNGKRVNPKLKHSKGGGDQFERSLKLCVISPSCVVIEKELFDQIGGFNEEFPVCEDYDLWLRITSKYKVGHIKDFLITKYGGHDDQLSRKYKAMDYWRVVSMDGLYPRIGCEIQKKQLVDELKVKSKILINGYEKHNNLDKLAEVSKILEKY